MESLEIVLVHLGSAKAPHLFHNIERLRSTHPDIHINLVVSSTDFDAFAREASLEIHQYAASKDVDTLLSRLYSDTSFRQGFWRFSMERLFAFTWLHQRKKEKSLLHIESDILILPDFPFEKFVDLNQLGWLKVDATRDVASIVFSPTFTESRWLEEELISRLSEVKTSTDMLVMHQIADLNPERICILPSVASHFPKLISSTIDISECSVVKMQELESYFGGIFDPAPYGMWLTGIDPRSNYGKKNLFDTSKIRNSGFYIDPSAYRYSYSESQGLELVGATANLRLWNLHVHSKSLNLFSKNWEKEISRLVELSQRERLVKEFDLSVLLKLVWSNVREGTIAPFIYYLPFMSPFRWAYSKISSRR